MQGLWSGRKYFVLFFLKSKLCGMIRQVSDLLLEKCKEHKSCYVSNENIMRQFLLKDGVHLANDRAFIFASSVVNFLNDFILTND